MILSLRHFEMLKVLGVFWLLLLFVAPGISHAFDGPGLYKDGKKILGFDLPAPAAATAAATQDQQKVT